MSFYGDSFVFNGVPSELYDLRIFNFDASGLIGSSAGGDVSIYEQWLYRRESPYFYGRYYQSSLEFDFTVGSFSHIDGNSRHAIETWLLGKSTYLPLRIVQGDIADVVYNVILSRSTHQYIGNLNYALTLHAKCDRPWAITYPPTLTKTYSNGLHTETFDYFNASSYGGYNHPVITFTVDTSGSSTNYFSLINANDNNREFRFSGLTPLEQIVVDNDKGIITSSTAALRMNKFNQKFFRTVQGLNVLTLSGYFTEFTLDAVFASGVGV